MKDGLSNDPNRFKMKEGRGEQNTMAGWSKDENRMKNKFEQKNSRTVRTDM